MRSNLIASRSTILWSRIEKTVMLYKWSKVLHFNLSDVTSTELYDMGMLSVIIDEVTERMRAKLKE